MDSTKKRLRRVAEKTGKSRRGAANLIYDKTESGSDDDIDQMFALNELMLELTGVPTGQALLPGYRFRDSWLAIVECLREPDTTETRAKLEALILSFRAFTSDE